MKIKVLIIDDSILVREILKEIYQSDNRFEVIGEASDPYKARYFVKELHPDLITLDVEMPKMDGLTFLEKLMNVYPTPVIMISSLTEKNASVTFKALQLGAVDYLAKPKGGTKELKKLAGEVIEKSLSAVHSKIFRIVSAQDDVSKKIDVDAYLSDVKGKEGFKKTEPIVLIGASTGGTVAIEKILKELNTNTPPIAIVQHMPEKFTFAFANRVNDLCGIAVKEAENGDIMEKGKALIAPGGKHLLIQKKGLQYYAEVKDGPLVNRHRPSVDVLFKSASITAGPNAYGFILTGMGDDGAKGLLKMKENGSQTFAQDENSCVVYGMPKMAVEYGAVNKIVPLNAISLIINRISSL